PAPAPAPAAAPADPNALVAQSEKAARTGNLEEAIPLLERALAVDPNHRIALYLLAARSSDRGSELDRPRSSPFYLAAGRALRRLRDTARDLNDDERALLGAALYNEACTYAVENQRDKAMASLAEAIDAGFDQPDLVAEDEELASIRKAPGFAELSRKIEK